jgi:hypothetical protein
MRSRTSSSWTCIQRRYLPRRNRVCCLRCVSEPRGEQDRACAIEGRPQHHRAGAGLMPLFDPNGHAFARASGAFADVLSAVRSYSDGRWGRCSFLAGRTGHSQGKARSAANLDHDTASSTNKSCGFTSAAKTLARVRFARSAAMSCGNNRCLPGTRAHGR